MFESYNSIPGRIVVEKNNPADVKSGPFRWQEEASAKPEKSKKPEPVAWSEDMVQAEVQKALAAVGGGGYV